MAIIMQAVSTELAALTQHAGEQEEEVRRLGGRVAASEQLLRAKEAEVEDLRHAYEGLALESRR